MIAPFWNSAPPSFNRKRIWMNPLPDHTLSYPPAVVVILQQVSSFRDAGNDHDAIAALLSVQQLVRSHPLVCTMLAYLLLRVDRPQDAVPWFEAVLAMNPGDASAIAGLGMACQAAGDLVRALQYYEANLVFRWNNSGSWYHHGAVLAQLGRLREALASLDRAIELQNDYVPAFAKRCQVLSALGDMSGAVFSALRCCELSPNDTSAWLLLGDLLMKNDEVGPAISAYDKGLALSPTHFQCLCNKAQALKQAGQTSIALTHVRAALLVESTNREALLLCGSIEQELGNAEEARACFLQVAAMGVARSYPAAHPPARFQALMLFSPFSGNTPYEDLISDSVYDTDVILVLPDHRYDPETVSASADVIVNLVSEADLRRDIVALVVDFVGSIEKPVVNHPRLILRTDRQTVAQCLAGIPGAIMPVTVHMDAAELRQLLSTGALTSLQLIVRHAGTHGGEKMELVSTPEQLLAFAEESGEQPLYLTDFVDYSSADGLFRKYRFIFVGDEIFPYHLAIGDVWKVHHTSTRMADVEWMRNEEQAFLDQPDRVFGTEAMAALDAIRREMGLDYFGIDCSLDADGRVVVFEVNASMLIHLHNEGFEYKTPYVMRIKHAFERLLERRVHEGRLSAEGIPQPQAKVGWRAF
jgi:tetratricopeptide (TPR) repeat protein/glutathione synthase/RimK-type ligase-like ATP-grasp enzyme